MELKNVGQCTLEKLCIASSFPELFTFGVCHSLPGEQGIYQQLTGKQTNQGLSDTEVREVSEVPIPGGTLYPGASVNMPVWVQGSGSSGKHQRDIMFYYEPEDKRPKTGWVFDHFENLGKSVPKIFGNCQNRFQLAIRFIYTLMVSCSRALFLCFDLFSPNEFFSICLASPYTVNTK